MDYILTVAVSISNGVAQITSGIPALADRRIELALVVIIIMTVVNLRGIQESGRVFAIPTYFFLAIAFLMLGVGPVKYLSGPLNPVTGVEMIQHDVLEPLTWFLVLRAFSSGCTGLTGIEAISNGITAFKEPRSKNAATTLIWMSAILVVIFLGFTFLANQIQAVPSHTQTVVSQMAQGVYGPNLLYFLTLGHLAMDTPWEQVLRQNSALIFNIALQGQQQAQRPLTLEAMDQGRGGLHYPLF